MKGWLSPSRRELIAYLARVTAGLIAVGVVAVSLQAYVAAEAIVAAIIVAVVSLGSLVVDRDDGL